MNIILQDLIQLRRIVYVVLRMYIYIGLSVKWGCEIRPSLYQLQLQIYHCHNCTSIGNYTILEIQYNICTYGETNKL